MSASGMESMPLCRALERAGLEQTARRLAELAQRPNVLEVKPVSADLKAVFETINAVNTGTNMYAVNKATGAPVLAALQAGFKQAVTSPAFVGEMQKRQLSVGYKSPDDIAATLRSLDSASPSVRQLLSKMLGG